MSIFKFYSRDELERAIEDELARVSDISYNSQMICRHFSAKVLNRLAQNQVNEKINAIIDDIGIDRFSEAFEEIKNKEKSYD